MKKKSRLSVRAAAGELFNRRTECSNGSARDDDDDKKKKRMEFILFYLSLSFTSGHNLNATSPPDSAIKSTLRKDQRRGLGKYLKAVSQREKWNGTPVPSGYGRRV